MVGDLLPDLAGPGGRGVSDHPTNVGRADLHIHTVASDGTASVTAVLGRAVELGFDIIAITDHERIDAAVAGRTMALDRGLPIEVIVGEEVTTLGGHLLALGLDKPVRSYRSLRSTIAAIHDQGALAVPAHPLMPYPLCAQAWTLRRLLDDPDETVHPDALETFNPTALGRPRHETVVRFAAEHGLAQLGNSDAHAIDAVGIAWTSFPGRTADDLRLAIASRATRHHGTFHETLGQLATFREQLRKRGRDARHEVAGRVRNDGTGRDHGYPGGRRRPPRFESDDGGPT
jgi:predicted metal-dependent phosphoesterase TrpH